MALDGAGRHVGALTSNIGHLLWSGAALPARVAQVAAQLTGPALCSGWGVRTMASDEPAFNPISYHCGTVWPHDTALVITGLVRAGYVDEGARLARDLLDAATCFDGRLPEVFAGLARCETVGPIRYPTASSPQAWAAGAPVQLVTELLQLQPAMARRALVSNAATVPDWLDGTRLLGIPAFGQRWNVDVRGDRVQVARA